MSKLIYLAIPYTWNPEKSFEVANEVAAILMTKGKVVFSPISHSHPISRNLDSSLHFDQEFWMRQDLPILERCNEVCVVIIGSRGLDLIEQSRGCQSEIKRAQELGLKIKYYRYIE